MRLSFCVGYGWFRFGISHPIGSYINGRLVLYPRSFWSSWEEYEVWQAAHINPLVYMKPALFVWLYDLERLCATAK